MKKSTDWKSLVDFQHFVCPLLALATAADGIALVHCLLCTGVVSPVCCFVCLFFDATDFRSPDPSLSAPARLSEAKMVILIDSKEAESEVDSRHIVGDEKTLRIVLLQPGLGFV